MGDAYRCVSGLCVVSAPSVQNEAGHQGTNQPTGKSGKTMAKTSSNRRRAARPGGRGHKAQSRVKWPACHSPPMPTRTLVHLTAKPAARIAKPPAPRPAAAHAHLAAAPLYLSPVVRPYPHPPPRPLFLLTYKDSDRHCCKSAAPTRVIC